MLLLAGCAKSSSEQAEEEVEAYLKQKLDDPSSYQPLHAVVTPYSRHDSAFAVGLKVRNQLQRLSGKMLIDGVDISALVEENRRLRQQQAELNKMTDTARIAWRVNHSYAARNRFGILLKLTDEFIVYPAHQVVVVREEE